MYFIPQTFLSLLQLACSRIRKICLRTIEWTRGVLCLQMSPDILQLWFGTQELCWELQQIHNYQASLPKLQLSPFLGSSLLWRAANNNKGNVNLSFLHHYLIYCRKLLQRGLSVFTWQKTNVLKIIVLRVSWASGPFRRNNPIPFDWRNHITRNWYKDCPKIFLHMTLLIKFPDRPTGALFISSSWGGSVARASAPNVSIIMLTHRSWTAVSGAVPEAWSYIVQELIILL